LFFVSIGLRADISKVATTKGIALVVVLFAVAIASKYLAGYSARQPNVDQALIGIGMIPRGEVGLIFANTAVGLDVFDSTTYSSVVVVVLLTTVVAPSLLRRRIEYLKTHQ
jgi:Kef-type K+ transport system membrane component KefB